jgi:hypothetical protein
LRKERGNNLKDIYIATLNILNQSDGSLTNEDLAHAIADMVRDEVDKAFMDLLVEFRKKCE